MSAATENADRIGERVERALGRAAISSLPSPCLRAPLPLAEPRDVAELAELLRLATREGWRVLPVGTGSKLGWSAPPARADLALSTRHLSGVVAYEPGDGTLTALAGTPMDELARTVRAGGHRLTPDVPRPERATLGGVIASGQSGICRLRLRPMRDHVLGLSVLLGDGTRVKSGGRLVKNVTGFDLHRLHTGAHGSLGILVEASLRLFPLPAHEVVVSIDARRGEDALELGARVLAEPIEPLAVVIEAGLAAERPAARLHVLLSGRAEGVERDLARLRPLLADPALELSAGEDAAALRRELRDLEPDADRTLSLRVTCLPGELPRALELVREWLRERDLPPALLAHPGIATLDVPLGAPAAFLDAGAAALHESVQLLRQRLAPRARVELRGATLALPEEAPAAVLALSRRVRASLDPAGTLASDRFRPAPA